MTSLKCLSVKSNNRIDSANGVPKDTNIIKFKDML